MRYKDAFLFMEMGSNFVLVQRLFKGCFRIIKERKRGKNKGEQLKIFRKLEIENLVQSSWFKLNEFIRIFFLISFNIKMWVYIKLKFNFLSLFKEQSFGGFSIYLLRNQLRKKVHKTKTLCLIKIFLMLHVIFTRFSIT